MCSHIPLTSVREANWWKQNVEMREGTAGDESSHWWGVRRDLVEICINFEGLMSNFRGIYINTQNGGLH